LGGKSFARPQCPQRLEIGEICAAAMRELNYAGAGTIEFLYEDGNFTSSK